MSFTYLLEPLLIAARPRHTRHLRATQPSRHCCCTGRCRTCSCNIGATPPSHLYFPSQSWAMLTTSRQFLGGVSLVRYLQKKNAPTVLRDEPFMPRHSGGIRSAGRTPEGLLPLSSAHSRPTTSSSVCSMLRGYDRSCRDGAATRIGRDAPRSMLRGYDRSCRAVPPPRVRVLRGLCGRRRCGVPRGAGPLSVRHRQGVRRLRVR